MSKEIAVVAALLILLWYFGFAGDSQKETVKDVASKAVSLAKKQVESFSSNSSNATQVLGKVSCYSDSECVTEFGNFTKCLNKVCVKGG